MNITLHKEDSVNAVITVDIVKADYKEKVEKSLKDLRRSAIIPGFRKGMVPPEYIRQKYGKSVQVEEINKIVSESLTDYIQENKLDILGEPLSSEKQAPIDFDNREDFTFTFDIALSPIMDVKLTKKDKMPYYKIQVPDNMIDSQIENFKAQYGTHESVKTYKDRDIIKGRLVELNENKEPEANGIINDSAVLMPAYMTNEEEKAKFAKAKLHSAIIFNPHTAYTGNEAELASFLQIKKEEVKNHTGDFSIEINEITRYKEGEINQKLFDKVLGAGTVDSEEAFREKIKENLSLQLTPESDYKFILDARDMLLEKVADIPYPEAFLKRWLAVAEPERTPESLEENFPKILNDLKFHLIKEQLIEENNITIDEGEMQEYAKRAVRAQFAQYGMSNLPDDLLDNYASDMLKKKETYRSIGDKIFEDKLISILKKKVTLKPQEISMEEFQKLIKK